MPDIPIVTIALGLIIRSFERRVRGCRTGPVGMIRIFLLEQLRQQMMEHAVVAIFETLVEWVLGFVPTPIAPTLLHFVVAAPERQCSVVAQAAHIFNCL